MCSHICKRFVAFAVLCGWVTAVAICAFEPLKVCRPLAGVNNCKPLSDDHLEAASSHRALGTQSDHHSVPEGSPTHPCDSNPVCQAIQSAFFGFQRLVLGPDLFLVVVRSILVPALQIQVEPITQELASVEERVICGLHKVCTRAAPFSHAPPLA